MVNCRICLINLIAGIKCFNIPTKLTSNQIAAYKASFQNPEKPIAKHQKVCAIHFDPRWIIKRPHRDILAPGAVPNAIAASAPPAPPPVDAQRLENAAQQQVAQTEGSVILPALEQEQVEQVREESQIQDLRPQTLREQLVQDWLDENQESLINLPPETIDPAEYQLENRVPTPFNFDCLPVDELSSEGEEEVPVPAKRRKTQIEVDLYEATEDGVFCTVDTMSVATSFGTKSIVSGVIDSDVTLLDSAFEFDEDDEDDGDDNDDDDDDEESDEDQDESHSDELMPLEQESSGHPSTVYGPETLQSYFRRLFPHCDLCGTPLCNERYLMLHMANTCRMRHNFSEQELKELLDDKLRECNEKKEKLKEEKKKKKKEELTCVSCFHESRNKDAHERHMTLHEPLEDPDAVEQAKCDAIAKKMEENGALEDKENFLMVREMTNSSSEMFLKYAGLYPQLRSRKKELRPKAFLHKMGFTEKFMREKQSEERPIDEYCDQIVAIRSELEKETGRKVGEYVGASKDPEVRMIKGHYNSLYRPIAIATGETVRAKLVKVVKAAKFELPSLETNIRTNLIKRGEYVTPSRSTLVRDQGSFLDSGEGYVYVIFFFLDHIPAMRASHTARWYLRRADRNVIPEKKPVVEFNFAQL